jgi:hypothetical protein
MNALTMLTLLSLACSAIIVALLLRLKRSFGSYTERIERTSEITRQSNEMTRQSNYRTVAEIEANTDENRIIHEKALAVFAEVANLRHELREIINAQRSA